MLEDIFPCASTSTLKTVDAVSGYVATVEIPSGGRCTDANMRKYNE